MSAKLVHLRFNDAVESTIIRGRRVDVVAFYAGPKANVDPGLPRAKRVERPGVARVRGDVAGAY